ncbi:flavin-binding monooxygenase-like domain-containing protein [Ditylenchus destructor]|nr:flavin-binding monooxygenase-like domain-containing protein [Ditylenchus destructor]
MLLGKWESVNKSGVVWQSAPSDDDDRPRAPPGKRCAVIGAGASGLPSARWALEYGFEPVVFELTNEVGGMWCYKSEKTELPSVMKSTVINSSKEMTAFSDFPPPAEFANFMHNTVLHRYFRLYARHHKLYEHIRFNHRVEQVRRAPDYNETGRWAIDYITPDGTKAREIFDAVLLGSGHHYRPYWPEAWPGQDTFKGRIIHSHDYKEPRGFEDGVTVVVGIGNSGVDVAVEQSRVAKEPFWISPAFLSPGQSSVLGKTGFVSETRGLRPLEPLRSWGQTCLLGLLESRPVQRTWPRLALSVRLAAFGRSNPYVLGARPAFLGEASVLESSPAFLGQSSLLESRPVQRQSQKTHCTDKNRLFGEKSRKAQNLALTYLSTRRGAWIFHKVGEYGRPFDFSFNRRLISYVKKLFPRSWFSWYIHNKLNMRFDHAKYGLKPKHDVWCQQPTINETISCRIISGSLAIKPNIKSFTEHGIVWDDGTVTDHVDNVVLCTGFLMDFPLLENGTLVPVKDNELSTLYKFTWPANLAGHNTLAIIGNMHPIGSIMPISEMQARVFFDVLVGRTKLPSETEMFADIHKKRAANDSRYIKSLRHTVQVDFVDFMDELGDMIGCAPYPSRLFWKSPRLMWRSIFGQVTSYQYRVFGPHAWSGAVEAALGAEERVDKCMKTCYSRRRSLTY